MTEHPTLFDSLNPTPVDKVLAPTPGRLHRNALPSEKQAAEKLSVRSGTQRARVLLVLDRLGDAIPHQLHAEAGCAAPSHATTRLEELRDLGLVEMTTERRLSSWNGRPFVWKILPAGREVAAQLRERSAA